MLNFIYQNQNCDKKGSVFQNVLHFTYLRRINNIKNSWNLLKSPLCPFVYDTAGKTRPITIFCLFNNSPKLFYYYLFSQIHLLRLGYNMKTDTYLHNCS